MERENIKQTGSVNRKSWMHYFSGGHSMSGNWTLWEKKETAMPKQTQMRLSCG